jgi:hypothetical protein
MIEQSLDTSNSILLVRPKSALEAADFAQLAKSVDPHIEKTGGLAERLASHFVAAEIRRFRAGELDATRQWILART